MSDRRTATFFTKTDCLMCHEAQAAIEAAAPLAGVTVVVVDIAADAAAADSYGERVPVLTGGGRVLLEGAGMTPRRVAIALAKLRFGLRRASAGPGG